MGPTRIWHYGKDGVDEVESCFLKFLTLIFQSGERESLLAVNMVGGVSLHAIMLRMVGNNNPWERCLLEASWAVLAWLIAPSGRMQGGQ